MHFTKEDFIGYPESVTTLPVYFEDDGELFGWGHLDKSEVIKALASISEYHNLNGELDDVQESDISHTYAKAYNPDKLEPDEWAFELCPWDDEGAFPVTFMHL